MNEKPISSPNHCLLTKETALKSDSVLLAQKVYNSTTAISVEQFEHFNKNVEAALDATDKQSKVTNLHHPHNEVLAQ